MLYVSRTYSSSLTGLICSIPIHFSLAALPVAGLILTGLNLAGLNLTGLKISGLILT